MQEPVSNYGAGSFLDLKCCSAVQVCSSDNPSCIPIEATTVGRQAMQTCNIASTVSTSATYTEPKLFAFLSRDSFSLTSHPPSTRILFLLCPLLLINFVLCCVVLHSCSIPSSKPVIALLAPILIISFLL